MATLAQSSKSSLTRRISLPALEYTTTTGVDTPNISTGTHPVTPRTSLDESTNDDSPEMSSSTIRSVWYLGGNQLARLVASVEGDLDPSILATIAEVPSVVGDLALSVESLVSDDVSTVGGFESDLLAKIASNTLASKQQYQQQQQQQQQQMTTIPPPVTTAHVLPPSPPLQDATTATIVPTSSTTVLTPSTSETTMEVESLPRAASSDSSEVSTTSFLVPNPLANYDPVPNPLARITPPASPLPTPFTGITSATTTTSPTTAVPSSPTSVTSDR